jgi:tungstate transport system ATP-binding protein
MNEVIYHLQEVRKEYDARLVLQLNELEIKRGEVLALVGPSGAGKSTLLRLLNFLETPSQGVIAFMETEFSASKPIPLNLRRRVTTVFQSPILLKRSVYANVNYGLRLRGKNDANQQTQSALERVGLAHLAKQPARTLSGGEGQRVALARAMVIQPDVLLLDEPTANLDPFNVGLIEDIIRDLNRQQGTTLVLVTHNVFQAKRLAQRVALMLEGHIIELADVDTFFNDPHDPRTAAFVRGEMVY